MIEMTDYKELLVTAFWFFVLMFLAWPLSIMMGAIYGFLTPFTTCFGLDSITNFLLRGVNLAKTCATNMLQGVPSNPEEKD
ncbi:hypothetical protein NDU88_001125 [Pleurodeles waltl]|uniref:Uncharacterized protein n=1 Tax=Pleurodeles waltl TaxID=8319 RepID=A0AAV7MKX3_PLEWA|nr:hypothetical protein NDU88_001125 [Pleurodeles waltl]